MSQKTRKPKVKDVSKICRGCYGYGDGCCSYHANKFRMMKKKLEKGK